MYKIILATLLLANFALADDNSLYVTSSPPPTAIFTAIKPNHSVTFSKDGKDVGTLDFNSGTMKFTGNADESAKIFIRYLKEQTDVINSVCAH
jgi:hypothetical protein